MCTFKVYSAARKEVEPVSRAAERREMIAQELASVRHLTIRQLMEEFGVSRTTIRRDLDQLTTVLPIYTIRGPAGGICLMDGWVPTGYLSERQEELLRRLLPSLLPGDSEIMQSILKKYSKPKKG